MDLRGSVVVLCGSLLIFSFCGLWKEFVPKLAGYLRHWGIVDLCGSLWSVVGL